MLAQKTFENFVLTKNFKENIIMYNQYPKTDKEYIDFLEKELNEYFSPAHFVHYLNLKQRKYRFLRFGIRETHRLPTRHSQRGTESKRPSAPYNRRKGLQRIKND